MTLSVTRDHFAAFDAMPLPVAVLDKSCEGICFANGHLLSIMGPSDSVTCLDLAVKLARLPVINTESSCAYLDQGDESGQNHHFMVNWQEVSIADGVFLVFTFSEVNRLVSDLSASNQRLIGLLDDVGGFFYTKDINYRFTFANQLVCKLFGKPREEIIGKTNADFLEADDAARVREISDRPVVELGQTVTLEDTLSVEGRRPRTYLVVKKPIRDAQHNIIGLCGISTDITRQKQLDETVKAVNQQLQDKLRLIEGLQADLREQATRDHLTNLHNRRFFDEYAAGEFDRAQRSGQPLTIVLGDIDYFKQVNDNHGHDAGDEVIKYVAGIFEEMSRASDIVCRYGGEEFIMLLPNTSIEVGQMRAESLRVEIGSKSIDYNGDEIKITSSFGVSNYPAHGASLVDIIIEADRALYRSKHQGRNTVTVAS